jgi:predicted adenine nucleotide alpha hydrolase (AANH) superfamily ATPase
MGKFVLGVQRYENRTIFVPMKRNIIQAPMGETTVLLHTCCAPCSSAIIEALLQNGITPIIYYCNPNIYPQEEYDIRKNECTRYAQSLGLEIIDADYDHENWLSEMKGLECEPERGGRCLKCFKLRLLRTAQYARERGLKVITTTLASSRWKSLDQINEAGRWACGMTETIPPDDQVIWWDQNWRKGGLQERRNQIIREYDFYNQRYCGCEFSMPKDDLTSMQPAFTSEGTDSLV